MPKMIRHLERFGGNCGEKFRTYIGFLTKKGAQNRSSSLSKNWAVVVKKWPVVIKS